MTARISPDERRRLISASLQVGNPGSQSHVLPPDAEPNGECQMVLPIEQIRPYEHNPRRTGNAKFEDIKESIRTGGLRSPLTVTRRPGEAHFIVEAGGNTRLLALRQLWAETREARFERLVVLYRPWRSESHVLTAHLIENEQRGDMSFWDRATGLVALKERLQAEAGRELTLRPLEDALHGLGLSVSTATLGLYLFACERLRTLGEAVPDLAGLDVKTLQPRLNALRRVAQELAGLSEEDVYVQVFEPAFQGLVARLAHQPFTVSATVAACEQALADHLHLSLEALRAHLDHLSRKTPKPNAAVLPPPVAPLALPSPIADTAATGSQGMNRWLTRVNRFAELAGVSQSCRLETQAPKGFRVGPRPAEAGQPDNPAQQRAWALLAMVAGEEVPAAAREVVGSSFFSWLADPGDPMAEAFWEVLDGLRPVRDGVNLPTQGGGDAGRA